MSVQGSLVNAEWSLLSDFNLLACHSEVRREREINVETFSGETFGFNKINSFFLMTSLLVRNIKSYAELSLH